MINFVQAVLVGETERKLFHIDLAEHEGLLKLTLIFFIYPALVECQLSSNFGNSFLSRICKKICSHNETLPPSPPKKEKETKKFEER